MKSFITFLLPGLGQLFGGDARKGGIMFLSAVVAGALTGGLGYLACGAWSVADLHSRPSSSKAKSPTATLLGTTDVPPARGGEGAFHAVMPWLFKFSILGLCTFLVLNNVRSGGALQSLEMFGVRLHFASLASEAGAASASEAGVDSGSTNAAFDAVANSLVSDPGNPVPSTSGGDAIKGEPAAYPAAPVGVIDGGDYLPAGSSPSFAGQWNSDLGATYAIRENNGIVEITETSKILFVPFVSMTCIGQSTGTYVSAECTTYDGQTGQLVLARDPVGGLDGVFTAYANGMQIPLNLRR